MNDKFSVTTVLAHKGGVGKTFTLRLLYQGIARILPRYDSRKILIVDCDPQGNTSSRWLPGMEVSHRGAQQGRIPPLHPDENERSDVTDIWYQSQSPLPYHTSHPLIDIVPSNEFNIYDLPRSYTQNEIVNGLDKWVRESQLHNDYAMVFIDTPPNKGDLVLAALRAASHVYIPIEYEHHPIDAMVAMLHLIEVEKLARKHENPLNFIGVVANKVPSSNATIFKEYRNLLRTHKTFGKLMLESEIKDLACYTATDSVQTTPGDIFDYPKSSHQHAIEQTSNFLTELFGKYDQCATWNLDFSNAYNNEQGE